MARTRSGRVYDKNDAPRQAAVRRLARHPTRVRPERERAPPPNVAVPPPPQQNAPQLAPSQRDIGIRTNYDQGRYPPPWQQWSVQPPHNHAATAEAANAVSQILSRELRQLSPAAAQAVNRLTEALGPMGYRRRVRYEYLRPGRSYLEHKRMRALPIWPTLRSLANRELSGRATAPPKPCHEGIYARHLSTLNEREYKIGMYDKIFTSEWVARDQILLGTKCNHLLLLHLETGKVDDIPTVEPFGDPVVDMHCGIHSMACNPSRTLVATGGRSPHDLALYELPSLDPVALSEKGHSDWLFDVCWLDDEYLASGGRDGILALWRADHHSKRNDGLMRMAPVASHINWYAESMFAGPMDRDKVRALSFDSHKQTLAALNLSALLKLFDVNKLVEVSKFDTDKQENVCLAFSEKMRMYAVGTRSDVVLLDDNLSLLATVRMPTHHCGVRSLSFADDVLTIGTGSQELHFFSVRANRFLMLNRNGKDHIKLTTGNGWLRRDDMYEMLMQSQLLPSIEQAVFTHNYDQTGRRLFTAGGPLPASIAGNYVALWQ